MDKKLVANIISILEIPQADEEALINALLLFFATLQDPSTYKKPKLYPVSEIKDTIHWTMLALPVIAKRFSNGGVIKISSDITAHRELGADGKFTLRIDKLFPVKPKDDLPTFEFDVCISFAGEQRSLAESIANRLKDEFHLKVFYDDFEKLKLWGRDLFNYLYEVYSRKSQYCIVLFSRDYLTKNWTVHELRAVQARILKERSSYVLPIVVEPNVKLPIEFENVAYVTLGTDNLESFCSEVNDRIWATKSNHWLAVDELAEILTEGFQFSMFFSPFKDRIAACKKPSDQLRTFLLGLSWCCSQLKMSEEFTGLLEYLLFSFPPISMRFKKNDEIVIVPPNGVIRRMIGLRGGPVLMKESFWGPIIAKWKEQYPEMFSNSNGYDSDKNKV